MPPGLAIGDGYISIGADLTPLKNAVAQAQNIVKGIPGINVGGNTGKAATSLRALEAAQQRAALAAADHAGKVKILQTALLNADPAGAEFYNVLARLRNANNALTTATQQLTNIQLQANQSTSKYATSVTNLTTQLAGLTRGTAQYEIVEKQLAAAQALATKETQANIAATKQLEAAELRMNLAGKSRVEQINILRQSLIGVNTTSKQYYDTMARIQTLQAQNTAGIKQTNLSINGLYRGMQALLGLQFVRQIGQWSRSMIELSNTAELTNTLIREVSVSYERYANVLATARRGQQLYGGSLQQNEESLSRLIAFSNRYGIELGKIDNLIRRLATSDPEQGVVGASISIREALSGDVTSIARRFEIPRSALRDLSNQMTSIPEKVKVLDRVLNELGVSNEVLAAQANTNAVALRRLGGVLTDIAARSGNAITTAFRPLINTLTESLTKINQLNQYFSDQSIEILKTSQSYDVYIAKYRELQALRSQTTIVGQVNLAPDVPQLSPEQFGFQQQLQRYSVEVDKAQRAALTFTDAQIRSGQAFEASIPLINQSITAHRGATSAVYQMGESLDETENDLARYRVAVNNLNAALASMSGVNTSQIGAAISNAARGQLVAIENATKANQRYEQEQARLGLAIHQAEYALGPFEDAVKRANKAVEDQRDAIQQAEDALDPYRQAVEDAAQAIEDQQDKIRDAERALDPLREALEAANDEVERQRDALDAAERALEPFRTAVEQAQEAVDAQKRAVQEAEAALKPYKEAIDAAQQAVDDQRYAIELAERGLRDEEAAVEAANKAVREQEAAIRAAEKALDPYRKAIKNAQDAVEGMQRQIELAERALRPFEDAVKAAQKAEEDQQRAIAAAERALRPYKDAVQQAQDAVDAQSRSIAAAERALRPYKDAVEQAQDQIDQQQRAIADAERALRPYTDAVEESQAALEKQKAVTDDYKESLDEQNKALDDAKRKQSEWANVPLTGSKAFSDRLFEIDQQTAEIQRKLLDLRIGQDEHIKSPLEIQLEKVNDQVQATAMRLSQLRASGGNASDIASAEAAYRSIRGQQDTLSTRLALEEPIDNPEIKALEKQLSDLGTEAEKTRLDEKLQLDPLRRQLEGLGKTTQEMSFDDIVKGYQDSTAEVDRLTAGVTQAQAAFDAQQAILDADTAAHERNQAALKAQQDAIEPLRDALATYQLNLENANLALDAQDRLIDPLRQKLEGYQLALDNANLALDAQDRAIEPLRRHLEELGLATQAAQDALQRQQDAIQPLRDQLVGLEDNLRDAQDAFDGANEALDPMRENLETLQGAAAAANDELARQQALIQPLKDALIPLNDALRDANEAYERQDELIDPLRTQLGLLEGNLDAANRALDAQEKLLKPLRVALDEAEQAQRRASKALEAGEKAIKPLNDRLIELEDHHRKAQKALDDQMDAIEPARRHLKDLELSYKATQKALDDKREAIAPLMRQMDLLGLNIDANKIKIDNGTQAIKDMTEAARLAAENIPLHNLDIKKSFEDLWDRHGPGGNLSIPGVVEKGTTDVHTSFLNIGLMFDWLMKKDGLLDILGNAFTSTFDTLATNAVGSIARMVSSDPAIGIVGALQFFSDTVTGENGLLPVFRDVGIGMFLKFASGAVQHISDMINGSSIGGTNKLGILGLFGSLHTGLFQDKLGWVAMIYDDMATKFDAMRESATGAIGNLVGDWGAGTGVLGSMHTLWTTLTGHAAEITDAITGPFTSAGAAISGIMEGFGDTIINGLNTVLGKIREFGGFIGKGINWISQKILHKDVIDMTGQPTDQITPILRNNDQEKTSTGDTTRLATGTNNWSGGWATTGEQGGEVAILPAGGIAGNPTYLPPGTKVLPHQASQQFLERGQGEIPTLPPGTSMWDLVTGAGKGILEFILNGPMLIDQALGALSFPDKLNLDGAFEMWNIPIRRNLFGFANHLIKQAAAEALAGILPEPFASSVLRGIQNGGTAWDASPKGVNIPLPGDIVEPPSVVEGAGYPTGIGLASALAAIIDGGYLTQGFSARHPAIDIGAGGIAGLGKAIRALIGGKVIASGYKPALEGQYIITEDALGRGAYYGHMVEGSQRYRAGEMVGPGSVLGGMGMTGQADAPHVHFEMRLFGRSVNPLDVFSGAFRWPQGPQPAPTTDGEEYVGPANVEGWLTSAMRRKGVGADWLPGLTIIAMHESGGNPNIVQRITDINSQLNPNIVDGDNRARGLMQVIPTTYNAFVDGFGRQYIRATQPGDIFDPVINPIASMGWIKHRYGHPNSTPGVRAIRAGQPYQGYATGGMINEPIWGVGASGQMYTLGERGSEMVLSNEVVRSLEQAFGRQDRARAVSMPGVGPATQPIVVEEKRVVFDVDVHQQRLDNERDLMQQTWVLNQLHGGS